LVRMSVSALVSTVISGFPGSDYITMWRRSTT
jgi:hypothetical protein